MNLKPAIHPYFSQYKYLQQLCLLILRHQSMQYSQSNSPVYGILFDGAWLWEEYLATILCNPKLGNKKFEHPENKTGKGGIRLFDNSVSEGDFTKCYRRIYPDFYRKNSRENETDFTKNDGIILDAKYKTLENGLVRDDLYQIISYMHTMQISQGGFIYPLPSNQVFPQNIKPYRLAGLGGTVTVYRMPIPESSSYEEFRTHMKNAEKAILQNILE